MQSLNKEFKFDDNQLLFNLDAPARTQNLLFKSHKPQPVIIEKIGPNAEVFTRSPTLNKSRSLQFSAISEDSLNMAVQLAKRDLKKQKEDVVNQALGIKKPSVKSKLRSHSPATKTKIIHSKEHNDKMKKRQERDKSKPLLVRERQRGRTTNARSAQGRRDRTPPGSILHPNADLSNLPVTTNSPPTRDMSAPRPLSGDRKIMHEIKRLRIEMEKCMKQIKDIQQTARQDVGRSGKRKYAEDIEEARKRKIRSEEQTSRSSRMIYMLNQQVKVIQSDIDKMQGHNVKRAKKSQTMSKLAAAHRGTVRVLQNFVSHLSDYDLNEGMPRSYQEIALLLRQLSLCCAQLEVSGKQDVPPDSVMCLIKDMADLNKMIDMGLTGSPSANLRNLEPKSKSRSPARRNKMADHKKEVVFEDEELCEISHNSAFMMEKLDEHPSVQTRDVGTDPCSARVQALRQGVQSLLHAADDPPLTPRTPRQCSRHPTPRYPSPRQPSPHDVPPLNLPVTPRTPATPKASSSRREKGALPVWETLMHRNKKVKKGLLLPHHLQKREWLDYPKSILKTEREKTQRRLVDLGEAHYAQATHSSRMKEVGPEDLARSREASPSPSARRVVMGSPRTPRRHISREEVARQVWDDRQRAKSEIEHLDTTRLHRQKVEDVSFRLGRSAEWVAATERRIRAKIEPLISQAEVEVNADLLSEMILNDMVNDVAKDVYNVNEDKMVTNDARTMMDLPDLETVMSRLHQMEEEQLAIRQRWATIVYDDDYDQKARTTYYDAGFLDRPRSPLPIELSRAQTKGCDPVQGIIDSRINSSTPGMSGDDVIMFTNVHQKKPEYENLQLSRRVSLTDLDPDLQRLRAMTAQDNEPIYLYLTQEIIQSIDENKDKFEKYLKKMNFSTVGRFNPQKIVAEIADEIMADCVQEVSKELWEINNDIVEHTYKSEFKDAGLPTSPDKTVAKQ